MTPLFPSTMLFRSYITNEGLLIVGSETGMVVVPESNIIEKGRLGPGQMIAVDLDEGRFYHDGEIKDRIASAQPYGEWVKGFTSFSGLKGFDAAEIGRASCRERVCQYV